VNALELHVAFDFTDLRAIGDDVEQTCRCVLAEQHALRAAQHLDAGNVVERADRTAEDRVGKVHFVLLDRNARFQRLLEGERADAADGEVVLAADLQAGRGLVQLAEIVDAQRTQRVGSDGGDADRNVLQALTATLGGDDDFARYGSVCCSLVVVGLCEGRHRREQRDGCD
jgi:hypothetical protein